MAEFSFEDAVDTPPSVPAAQEPKSFSFAEATQPPAQQQPKSFSFDEAAQPKPQADKPMPGFFEALQQGVERGGEEVQQGIEAIHGQTPKATEETSPAAQPYEWRDVYEPNRFLKKTAYGLAKSFPTLAGGIGGGAVGTEVAGPVGTVVGGAGGAGAAAALQTLGPEFAKEAKQTPNDLDGAWSRAVNRSIISGAFSAAGWAAFPIKPWLNGPIKNLAFQMFGVQPAVSVAEKATLNRTEGRPITEDLGQAYAQGVAGSVVPLIGHAAIEGSVKAAGTKGYGSIVQQTAAQQAVQQSAQQKFMGADMLEQYAQTPGLTTDQVYNARLQAEMQRQEAKHETFLANIPPQLADRGLIKSTIFRNLLPELTSEKALQAAPRFGEFASSRAQDYDSLLDRSSKIRNAWDWVPFADTLRWFDVYETKGATLPPDLAQKYPFMVKDMPTLKGWLKQAYFDEHDVGSKAAFVQEYFPHLFEKPDAVKTMFTNLITPGTQGATWFQKARYYDLISHALNNGMKLRSTNPVDLVSMRLMSGADMRAKMNLLNDLNAAGVATPVADAPAPLMNTMRMPHPWQEVSAPNGTKWLLAPDVQSLWENAVVSKGLWADPGIMGRAFRGWMSYKTALLPVKLGLSLFHPVHVVGIGGANNMSRAFHETFGPGQQSAIRRLVSIPEAIVQSVADPFLAFPIGLPYKGKTVREGWRQIAGMQTPQQQGFVKMYQEAGVSPQLSEQLRSRGNADMQAALVKAFGPDSSTGQRAIGAAMLPVEFIKKLSGYISKPFFEEWIPNLKAAALAREVESLARRRPDIMMDDLKRKVALSALGRQVDNRFGEMFYGSLNWNRTLKDSAIASFLSLGWNLGFAREFVGGALEPAARRMMEAPTPTRALIRDVTSKSTNLIAYSIMAMTFNAMVNKYFTGEDAKGLDYIFPRFGGANTDGSPRRLSTPHYTREIPMVAKNIEDQGGSIPGGIAQTIWHKMMIAPIIEYFQNRDYFGGEIYDQTAPAYVQAKQFFTHLVTDQISPMSIAGARRSLELSGKQNDWQSVAKGLASGDKDVIAPLLGYGPAPSYASRDSMENRIYALGRRFVFPAEKPFAENEAFKQRLEAQTQYRVALQNHDQEGIKRAVTAMVAAGMSNTQIKNTRPQSGAPNVFQRLGQVAPSLQISLLKDMTAEQFKVYYPKASKTAKADKSVQALASEYYHPRP